MGKPAMVLKNPMLQKLEPYIFEVLLLNTTGTVTIQSPQLGYPVIVGSAAGDFVQATVDSFLGVANDIVVATSFGSTAMGTDSFGFILGLNGQAASAVWCEAQTYLGAVATNLQGIVVGAGTVTTALPNTLTAGFAVTAAGNVYGRVIQTGFDAATAPVLLRVAVLMK